MDMGVDADDNNHSKNSTFCFQHRLRSIFASGTSFDLSKSIVDY